MVRAVSWQSTSYACTIGVPVPEFRARAVRLWLLAAAAMIFMTLIVGGATRLTESGLSIVEWKPVTGVLPPLSAGRLAGRIRQIQGHPAIPRAQRGMNLAQFKTIYWWEWTHRLLARTTGAVFLLPFLCFLWRGAIPPPLRTRLWMIFAGGALLGVVGWWMVSSGLVRHARERLAIPAGVPHDACLRDLCRDPVDRAAACRRNGRDEAPPRLRHRRVGHRRLAAGADLSRRAGRRASTPDLKYNTWPLIDGALIPPLRRLLFIHPTLAQFVREHPDGAVRSPHVGRCDLGVRRVACRRRGGSAATCRGAVVLAAAVTLQAALGIVTLLYQAPLHSRWRTR